MINNQLNKHYKGLSVVNELLTDVVAQFGEPTSRWETSVFTVDRLRKQVCDLTPILAFRCSAGLEKAFHNACIPGPDALQSLQSVSQIFAEAEIHRVSLRIYLIQVMRTNKGTSTYAPRLSRNEFH